MINKKLKVSQVNDLALNIRVLGEKQRKPSISEYKGVIKIRVAMSEMEILKKRIQRINKTKNWVFEKEKGIDVYS